MMRVVITKVDQDCAYFKVELDNDIWQKGHICIGESKERHLRPGEIIRAVKAKAELLKELNTVLGEVIWDES